jgi:hypothetical protein
LGFTQTGVGTAYCEVGLKRDFQCPALGLGGRVNEPRRFTSAKKARGGQESRVGIASMLLLVSAQPLRYPLRGKSAGRFPCPVQDQHDQSIHAGACDGLLVFISLTKTDARFLGEEKQRKTEEDYGDHEKQGSAIGVL